MIVLSLGINKKKEADLQKMRRPGIEPGSTAWKATMLTFTPPTQTISQYIHTSHVRSNLDFMGRVKSNDLLVTEMKTSALVANKGRHLVIEINNTLYHMVDAHVLLPC